MHICRCTHTQTCQHTCLHICAHVCIYALNAVTCHVTCYMHVNHRDSILTRHLQVCPCTYTYRHPWHLCTYMCMGVSPGKHTSLVDLLTQMHTGSCAQRVCALNTNTHSALKAISILRPELGAHNSTTRPYSGSHFSVAAPAEISRVCWRWRAALPVQAGCREGLQLFLLGLE